MTDPENEAADVRLLTLGTVAVRGPQGEDLTVMAGRPKELALLVYLAVAGRHGPVRRDTLLALFWPELEESRARGALSQTMYRLRRSLGGQLIVSQGRESLALGDGCWCDAAALLDHLERKDPARALELYRGEFLPGFHLAGALGFEEWSQGERARLQRLAGDAAERLDEDAEASGDLSQAARWLRRKVEITPTDESALGRLVVILDRLGDRAGAVRAYEEFARQLALAYELEPAPETRALIDDVRARERGHEADVGPHPAMGERDVVAGRWAPIEGLEPAEPTIARAAIGHENFGAASAGARRAVMVSATVALGVAGAATIGWLLLRDPLGVASADLFDQGNGLLVADVENRTDIANLGLAIRDALATDLDGSVLVKVVDRVELTDVLDRMRRPDTAAITVDVALEIARREGFGAVLWGSVSRLGSGYQLNAQILTASTGEPIVRERETAAGEAELIDATQRLSRRLRRRLGESMRDIRASPPLPRVTTTSLEALTLLARGHEHARQAQWRPAIRLAEQAVALDTAFAAAHTALAGWYNNVANPSLAEWHAERAYRHAGRLPALERMRAAARYHSRHGRLDSVVHYRQAMVDRDPGNGDALVGLGNAHTAMGRLEEALDSYRRALLLAPQNVTVLNKVMVTARRMGLVHEADSVLALMGEHFPDALPTRIGMVARDMHAGELERADSLARIMALHANPEMRLWGQALDLLLSSARGRLHHAIRLADSLHAATPPTYGPEGATAFLRLLEYAALAAGAPERALPAITRAENQMLAVRPSLGGVRALGVVANGYVLAGRTDAARRVLARMDSLTEANDLRTGISYEVRAMMALGDAEPEQAIQWVAHARSENLGGLSPAGRLALADAYAATGRYQDAAGVYESVLRTVVTYDFPSFYFGPMWPLAHERLGGVYELLGDTTAAVRNLRAFVELWSDADDDLQPRVEAARQTIRRLRLDSPAGPE
jgi:DNA-binding SARP family transcriptional activator